MRHAKFPTKCLEISLINEEYLELNIIEEFIESYDMIYDMKNCVYM